MKRIDAGSVRILGWALAAVLCSGLFAATPPTLINYQGVLRSAADAPLSGAYDMVFRFWDGPTGGAEILIDQHTAAGANAVTVSGGLFDVALGGGTLADGSGPGTYAALDAVFRDYSGVWLEVSVGGETLTPRTRIHSAPFSLNATSAADAARLAGQPASFFLDSSSTTQTKLGRVTFDNAAGTGFGVEASGPDGGGYFRDSNQSGYAYLGYDNYGMYGYGNTMGAYFKDLNNSGYSYVGVGDIGIESYGIGAGGYFRDSNENITDVYAATAGKGVLARGTLRGGEFSDSNSTAYAYVAYQDDGIQAYGAAHGGYFSATDSTGWARVGYSGFGGFGIMGYGYGGGGFFSDRDGSYAYAGYGAYKVYGTGTVSFVQNHPTRTDRSIVYAAPEGDEVAVYTRGSGRLAKGEARVALGETFALVANPDLGITAHVTPRGDARLWVEAVSPSEIVVRGPAGADVAFDYIVYGLRIGFESLPIVQVKRDEAFLPTASTIAEFEGGAADTVASSALVRYRAEHERLHGRPADLSRAGALAARINAGRETWYAGKRDEDEKRRRESVAARESSDRPPAQGARPVERSDAPAAPVAVSVAAPVTASPAPVEANAERERPAGTTLVLKAAVAIEAGELVSLDPVHPGTAARSATPGEALIVGCALVGGDGDIAIATAGVALCRADASTASIEVGDLLVASSIEGHAMKHDGSLAAPAILGRAVDPLPVSTGLIRVLLGAR